MLDLAAGQLQVQSPAAVGSLASSAAITLPLAPGAGVVTVARWYGPARMLPGPSARLSVPVMSRARSPVFRTTAEINGTPSVLRVQAISPMSKPDTGSPPGPTLR